MSSRTPVLLLGLMSVLLMCCGGDVKLFPANCRAEPVFTLLLPTEGQVITTDTLTVQIEVANFQIVNRLGEPPAPCEGHFHVFLNDSVTIIPETEFDLSLESVDPGPVEFVLEVHNNDHTLIEGIAPITRHLVYDPGGGGGGETGLLASYLFSGNADDSGPAGADATYYLEGYSEDRFDIPDAAAGLVSRSEAVRVDDQDAFARPVVVAPHLAYSSSFTMAGWFLHHNIRAENPRLFGQGNWVSLYLHDGNLELGRLDERQGVGPSVSAPATQFTSIWTFAAGVVDFDGTDSTLILYVNGEEVARETFADTELINPGACSFFIGPGLANVGSDPVSVNALTIDAGSECDATRSFASFAGSLDDVQIYDRALSAAEIRALFEAE